MNDEFSDSSRGAPDYERRFFEAPIELEEREEDGDSVLPVIRGVAAVFGKKSEEMFGFRETIAEGAFDEVLGKNPDVRALFNHEPSNVLGRTRSGTLSLLSTKRGLEYRIQPPDTTAARDLIQSIKRGDVSQSSFGFRVASDGDKWERQGKKILRTILRVSRLFDVSPVTFPAYPQTSVSARDMVRSMSRDPALAGQMSLDMARRRLTIFDLGARSSRSE